MKLGSVGKNPLPISAKRTLVPIAQLCDPPDLRIHSTSSDSLPGVPVIFVTLFFDSHIQLLGDA